MKADSIIYAGQSLLGQPINEMTQNHKDDRRSISLLEIAQVPKFSPSYQALK